MGGMYHADSCQEFERSVCSPHSAIFKWLVENWCDVPGDLLRSHTYRKHRRCKMDEKTLELSTADQDVLQPTCWHCHVTSNFKLALGTLFPFTKYDLTRRNKI